MAIGKFQVTLPFGPALPENVVVHTFYLNDTLPNEWPGSTDWGKLCDDAAAAWQSSWTLTTSIRPITVKVYNAQGAPPHDPLHTSTLNATAALNTPNWPTQLAMCLSFKGGQRPWQRGRMFLAPWTCATFAGVSSIANRPSTAMQNQALSLADALAGLGGIDIDWGVYSKTHDSWVSMTQAWVDDSWDIQRRRKLDPTGRVTKSYSE